MKLKLNSVSNNSLRIRNRLNLISNIFKLSKKYNKFSKEFCVENLTSFKNNYENLNTVNMNNYTVLEHNNNISKEKKKTNRPINSAGYIKSRNANKKEELPKVVSSKQIHKFVSMLKKRHNLFNEIKKEHDSNLFFFSSMFNQKNKTKFFYNQEKTQDDTHSIRYKKNNELIPYPFKRLQKRMRNFFSLSKIQNKKNSLNKSIKREIKSDNNNENIINKDNNINNDNNNFKNKCLVKVIRIKNNKIVENSKKEDYSIYRNKIAKITSDISKRKIITKKDKSVSTDNIIFSKSNCSSNNKKISLFNNKLIASLTQTGNNINNISGINKNKRYGSSRSILIHHKN